MDILFMGTSEFAVPTLQMLHDRGWPVKGVVTRPDRARGRGRKLAPPVIKTLALQLGIPVYQPESTAELVSLMLTGGTGAELVVVVAYGRLLPEKILNLPPKGCVNLHPSLLPLYRGAAPMQRALINGETRSGVSTMYLSTEMDAGDIILQEELDLGPEMTYGEFSHLAATKGAELMNRTLELIQNDRAPRLPQDGSRATYAPPLRPEEEVIDWTWDAGKIHDLIRGMNPQPGAYTLFKGSILKVWGSRWFEGGNQAGEPGLVTMADPRKGLVVQTGSGQLLLTEVQPAGRSHMSGAEFVRGYRIGAGCRLGE